MLLITGMRGDTQNLRSRSLVAMFVIGSFILASQLIIYFIVVGQISSSRVINLAGRQRMLSQNIAKNALIRHQATDSFVVASARDELMETLDSFEQAHIGLQQGSSILGLPGANSRTVLDLFEIIEPHYQSIVDSATCILSSENVDIVQRSDCDEDFDYYLQNILTHEQAFLSGMDNIVFQYDAEAEAVITQLRNFSYLVTIIGSLGVIGIWRGVIRPSIRKVEMTQSKLEQQADALADARDEALNASSFKSQILMNVSHDARTPLSSIILSADILRSLASKTLTEKHLKHLDVITVNARRLTTFLQNLLEQSKIEAGSIQLVPEHLDPHQLGQEVEQVLRPLADGKGLTFEVTYNPDLPVSIYGDSIRLLQIINNLGHNAIKFTEKGAVSIHFSRHDDNNWCIRVKDTGQGIAPDALENIFDTFWQADGGENRQNQSGVGLGLSIVQSLVDIMKGRIEVNSEPLQGTEFVVVLPVGSL